MPLVRYSALRLILFGLALVGFYLAGARGWLMVVLAAFGAWALSYLLLRRSRDDAALYLATRRRRSGDERFGAGPAHDAEVEDAAVENATVVDGATGNSPAHGSAAGLDGGVFRRDDGEPPVGETVQQEGEIR